MGKILMLATANIKENKGQSVSLTVLVFIAALLLNTGLLTVLNFSNSFDLKAEQLNSPHVIVLMPESIYRESYSAYFNSYSGVTGTLCENTVLLPLAGFKYDNGTQSKTVVVMNASCEREVMKVSFIGETLSAGEHSIYVPYLLQTGGGYGLGDDFALTFAGMEYHFTIAGFTEDIVFSTINSSSIGFYLPEAVYYHFIEELNNDTVKGVMLSAVLEDSTNASRMISDFMESQITSEDFSYVLTGTTNVVRSSRTLTADIASMIIVAVAFVIVFISLIVIRFRIADSIEDGMTNIGVLKACGYTSRQIIGFFALQFSLLSMIGAVLGIGTSYLVLPLLSDSFSVQSGLIWAQGFDPMISFSGLCFLLLVVLSTSWISASRVNNLHPILALRGGIRTHNFRVNRFPLDTTRGNLHVLLSLKRIAQNLKQHGSIALIMTAVCFVAVFGLIMYNNFVISDGAIRLISGECPDVQVEMNANTENNTLLTHIAARTGVRKAIYYGYAACIIDYQEVLAYVTEDFEQTETEMLYEGRHPKHDNETAFNGYLAEILGKQIGDTVTITMGSVKEDYLLTGLFQTSNYLGMDIEMTRSGVERLQADYQWSNINIYLSDDTDAKEFIDELQGLNDQRISSTQDFQEFLGTFINSYASIVRILVTVLMVIVSLVILLILYLVIKATILREKRVLGIQKAVGFTTGQLMWQIALMFIPSVAFGVAAGGIAGYFATNPLLSFIFKRIGIIKVNFTISPIWVVFLSVGILLLAYAVSMLVAWRIRKISAYTLISE